MSWEVDNVVANSIALAASFLTIVMWLAPVRDVWTASYSIYRTGTTDNVATGFGFVAGTFNCILWNLFSFNRLNTMLVAFILNCAGFLLNISFVLCFYFYGNTKARRATMNQVIAMLIVTGVAVGIWIGEESNNVVGYFAAFVNVLMLFGPLAAAGEVIRARSARGLSLLPLVMTLVASITWFSYGVYIKEIPAMIPNGLGIIFGMAQILLFAWAKGQENKIAKDGLSADDFEPISPSRPIFNTSRDGNPVRERVTSISAVIDGIP